jgi:GrpB-like predicted nucleotidyltransferase (UPF0157 family)
MGGMHFLGPNEYQTAMKDQFEKLKGRLSRAIPYSEIEHVGSSAIMGALSKGDLDVLVRISKDRFPEAIEAIQSLGFSVKPGTLRTESLCMLEGPNEVAVQLIEKGSKFEMFVRFRDRMNADPSLVEKYNQLKLSCAGKSPNEYRAIKSKFIELVLAED